jgi:hypothetical protein
MTAHNMYLKKGVDLLNLSLLWHYIWSAQRAVHSLCSSATGYIALVPRWDKCLTVNGDYKEVWCVPSATHVPCSNQSQNKVLGSTVSAILFHETPWCKNWIYKNKNKILSFHINSFVKHHKNTHN